MTSRQIKDRMQVWTSERLVLGDVRTAIREPSSLIADVFEGTNIFWKPFRTRKLNNNGHWQIIAGSISKYCLVGSGPGLTP
jgi:hypothetical protein